MKSFVAYEPQVTIAVSGVHRVELDGEIVGYVQETGAVFVSLHGAVYNTSFEVGQSLDLDTAIRRVLGS